MVRAPRGFRHRTRHVLRKHIRERGAIPQLSRILVQYNVGDKVHIDIDPAIVKGMPHRRYQGKTGTIIGKRGKAYIVEVYLGNKWKVLFIRPEHLKPAPTPKPEGSQ